MLIALFAGLSRVDPLALLGKLAQRATVEVGWLPGSCSDHSVQVDDVVGIIRFHNRCEGRILGAPAPTQEPFMLDPTREDTDEPHEPGPDDVSAPGEEPSPTLLRRWWGWVKRTWRYTFLGILCMLLTIPVAIFARVFRLITHEAEIRVIRELPFFPISLWIEGVLIHPFELQVALIFSLVVWLALTGSWRRQPSEPQRAPYPLLVTLSLTFVGSLVAAVGADTNSWVDVLGLLLLYLMFALPLMAAATALTFEKGRGAWSVAMKWGVMLALMVSIHMLNARETPHVGATLAERDAWAREHMSPHYDEVASDLEGSAIVKILMGDDVRVAPINPSHGHLELELSHYDTLSGWLVIDDGRRAAKCEVDYDFNRGGGWEAFNHSVCTRDGVTFYMRALNKEIFVIESKTAHGIAQIDALWPDALETLRANLDVALDEAEVSTPRKPELTMLEYHDQSERVWLNAEAEVRDDSRHVVCTGGVYLDEAGEVFVPEDEPDYETFFWCRGYVDPADYEHVDE